MAVSAIRTIILYVFLILAFRITGKRQLGELQPVELVVTLLISDLAAIPMQDNGVSLLSGLIPIAILVSLELILSALMLKSNRLTSIISGHPVVVVKDGKVLQTALRKLRLTVDDLLESIRQKEVFDLSQVRYAIVETGGKISVFTKDSNGEPAIPVVNDGKMIDWGMRAVGISEHWIENTLKKHHCPLSETLLLTVDTNRHIYLVRKGEDSP